jgi:hypothetical protein
MLLLLSETMVFIIVHTYLHSLPISLFNLFIVYVVSLSMHALQIFQDLLYLLDRQCQFFRFTVASNNFLQQPWGSYMRKELLQEVTIKETERSNICIAATSSVMWRSESANKSISPPFSIRLSNM